MEMLHQRKGVGVHEHVLLATNDLRLGIVASRNLGRFLCFGCRKLPHSAFGSVPTINAERDEPYPESEQTLSLRRTKTAVATRSHGALLQKLQPKQNLVQWMFRRL